VAAAPQTFEEFRRLHPGVRNPAMLKAAWDKLVTQRQAAQRQQALAGPQPDPAFVPGALDESAQADMGALAHQRASAKAGALRDFTSTEADYKAQSKLLDFNRGQSMNRVTTDHAARGTLRSGLKAMDQGRVQAQYTADRSGLDNMLAAARQRLEGVNTEAEGAYTAGEAQIRAGSNARAYSDWASKVVPSQAQVAAAQPAGPARPAPAAPKQPEMTYQRFVQLHGGKSTAALAAAWRKRFGGG
jgi:hypothetical protein